MIASFFLLALAPFQGGADSELARDLLLRAAEAQRPQASKGPLQRFSAHLNVRERGRTRNELDLQLTYVGGDEERIALELNDPDRGVRVAKGLDEHGYWLREDGQERMALDGRAFIRDRRAIEDALEMSARLLLLLDLGRLPAGTKKLVALREGANWLVSGIVSLRGREREWSLLLDGSTLAPLGLELLLPILDESGGPLLDSDGKPQVQRPWFEFRSLGTFGTLRVPRVIREYTERPKAAKEGEKKIGPAPVRILELRALTWF